MTERERLVLNAIVNYYLVSGETIGSRALVKKYGIDFSSATIRNVMVDLEEYGYISKTHISSGRVPTDKGYRYYLNEILEIEKITKLERENIELVYEKKISELDTILSKTSALLSNLTSYAGIVIEPDHHREKIKKIELVHIDDDLIMAIIVMANKVIRTKKINLDYNLTKDEVLELSKEVNEKITKNEFTDSDIKNMLSKTRTYDKNHQIELALGKELFQDIEGKFFLNNAPSIIDTGREDVLEVMQLFDNNKDIKHIFEELVYSQEKDYGKVNVIFGDELNIKGLENYSFVYSLYKIEDSQGIIGVIGPKRMAYSKTIGLVDYVAKEVSKVIEEINIKEGVK
ncbi:MAG: heat-inducible transcriptional repressor HrcA [Fusobacteriaceae bacterium]